jgi:hypothetical protein
MAGADGDDDLEFDDAAPFPDLTVKQRKFLIAYLEGKNASEAARKAGYSHANARTVGYRMLRLPHIRRYVDEFFSRTAMSAVETVHHLSELGRYAAKDADRISALDKIGRFHQLFTEKVDVTSGGKPLGIDLSKLSLEEKRTLLAILAKGTNEGE